ncbi:MAG TPA: VOC family protein [Gemmataceae bacterium]|nr:VOC family protein [Gemmataceae bacterium]
MPITAQLVVGGAKKAIDFYRAAFGAVEVMRMDAEDGKRLMHAELKIGDSALYLADDFPEFCGGKTRDPLRTGGSSVTLHQYVPNCDAAIARAVAAGGTITMPAMDMFWGDRYGKIKDPFGHEWSFAHKLKK